MLYLPILDFLSTISVHKHQSKAKMNSLLGSTDRRSYSAVKLWLRGAINNDDDFHLLSLADVPFSSIQQLIAESGRSIDYVR